MPKAAAEGAARAFVGLGANLGEPGRAVAAAVRAIAALPGTRLVAVSSLYRSAPVDADGPDFLNAVAEIRTALAPHALLRELQAIERGQGRERPFRNAPRTLDLDLLLYDELVLHGAELELPHPRMHERAFVLRPLAELDASLRIPGRAPLDALRLACAQQRVDAVMPSAALLERSLSAPVASEHDALAGATPGRAA
jgi:2-amino-4-hydroxy-6-hydroxymethyldihydropteridine diphosphokinase